MLTMGFAGSFVAFLPQRQGPKLPAWHGDTHQYMLWLCEFCFCGLVPARPLTLELVCPKTHLRAKTLLLKLAPASEVMFLSSCTPALSPLLGSSEKLPERFLGPLFYCQPCPHLFLFPHPFSGFCFPCTSAKTREELSLHLMLAAHLCSDSFPHCCLFLPQIPSFNLLLLIVNTKLFHHSVYSWQSLGPIA